MNLVQTNYDAKYRMNQEGKRDDRRWKSKVLQQIMSRTTLKKTQRQKDERRKNKQNHAKCTN